MEDKESARVSAPHPDLVGLGELGMISVALVVAVLAADHAHAPFVW